MSKNLNRIQTEDALKHFHAFATKGVPVTAESLAGAISCGLKEAASLLVLLGRSGLATAEGGQWELTSEGKDYAIQVVRAHRLYETYLARETSKPATVWHTEAEVMEHRLTRDDIDQLDQKLGYPHYDPHGDPIPTIEGQTPDLQITALVDCHPGLIGRVAHVEDEPPPVYAKLVELGFAPGMRARVLENNTERVTLTLEGRTHSLDRELAANIQIHTPTEISEVIVPRCRLSDLKQGETAEVIALSALCRGGERRRLLDLGLVPGSKVEAEFSSPFQSPIAYRVRGTLIALRKSQAENIVIQRGVHAGN